MTSILKGLFYLYLISFSPLVVIAALIKLGLWLFGYGASPTPYLQMIALLSVILFIWKRKTLAKLVESTFNQAPPPHR